MCGAQSVLAELQRLKVAVSVKQVHKAAVQLKHAKQVMELQAQIDSETVRLALGPASSFALFSLGDFLMLLLLVPVRVQSEQHKELERRIEEGAKKIADEVC